MNSFLKSKNPYLRKHVKNPVEWHVWQPATLALASKKKLPLFISIGYTSCHWCHVMNRESFQNKAIAEFLNEHFIPIKIDREELPNIDAIYLRAGALLGVQGGWPLSVFTTPSGAPFFVGTYFPPEEKFGTASFLSVLQHCASLWQKRNKEIVTYALKVRQAVEASFSNSVTGKVGNENSQLHKDEANVLQYSLRFSSANFFPEDRSFAEMHLKFFDEVDGGFKFQSVNKFPHFMQLQHLHRIAVREKRADLWHMVTFSVKKMLSGGIYDFVDGGFYRYSTDYQWNFPHFEKTLYDNALALQLLTQIAASPLHKHFSKVASSESNNDFGGDFFLEKALDVYRFLEQQMMSENSLYYASLDAESGGEEGVYYVITLTELKDVLAEFAKSHVGMLSNKKAKHVSEKIYQSASIFFDSFFSTKSIPSMGGAHMLFNSGFTGEGLMAIKAAGLSISNNDCCKAYFSLQKNLLALRKKKVKPEVDEKNLLGWNSLVLSGLCKLATLLVKKSLNRKGLAISINLSLRNFFEKENTTLADLTVEIVQQAQRLGRKLEENFAAGYDMYFRRLAFNEKAHAAHLADYAAYGSALCHLAQLGARTVDVKSIVSDELEEKKKLTLRRSTIALQHFEKPRAIAKTLLENFYVQSDGVFFETMSEKKGSTTAERLFDEKAAKIFNFFDLQDGVEPCGNSLVAELFLYLSVYFPEDGYRDVLEKIFTATQNAVREHALPHLLGVLHNYRRGFWRLIYSSETAQKSNSEVTLWWREELLKNEFEDSVFCIPLEVALRFEKWLQRFDDGGNNLKKSVDTSLVLKASRAEKELDSNRVENKTSKKGRRLPMVLLCQHARCLLPAYSKNDFAKRLADIF